MVMRAHHAWVVSLYEVHPFQVVNLGVSHNRVSVERLDLVCVWSMTHLHEFEACLDFAFMLYPQLFESPSIELRTELWLWNE